MKESGCNLFRAGFRKLWDDLCLHMRQFIGHPRVEDGLGQNRKRSVFGRSAPYDMRTK